MQADRQTAMPGTPSVPQPPEIPDHELLCLVGRGAYGEVWLARNAIGTLRAVKVVYRQSFQRAEHFEREFKGLLRFEPISRSHDGLVDILQIGRRDDAGYFFYVMELADDASDVSGKVGEWVSENKTSVAIINPQSYASKTLRSLLRSPTHSPTHPLTHPSSLHVSECIAIGLKLASALEHLHANGLVHRDIKPSNIIFVNGEPKLADIGLVTAIDEAHSLVGTVGYIPPEGPGTPQADLYSLGKVLYEIAFGKDRHDFPQLPPDLQSHPDYAALLELNEVILEACETDPRRRYASAAALSEDLALLQRGQSVRRERTRQRRRGIVKKCGFATVLVALLIAGVWLLSNRFRVVRSQRSESLTAIVPAGVKSIAVLPFDNDSPDKADEYQGTSMAEETSSALGKIPGLRVLGRDSAGSLKKSKDHRAVGQQLKLDAALEGRVRKSGHQLQLTAQLANTADGFVLWSETYDRDMAEIFGIQTDIAEKVAQALNLKLTDTVRTRLALKPTKNLEAYQLYLEGLHLWTGQPHRAIEFFQSAIRLDPNFAAAYAGLADCYTDDTRERSSGRESFPKALVNATKAVELAPDLAEAHSSLARVKCHYEYDWEGAGKEFQLAIRLNPANGRVQQWYSQYLDMMGRFDEANARARLAKELDPLSASIRDTLAWNLFDARQYEQALEEFKGLLELDEGSALEGIGWCYVAKGRIDEAIPIFEKNGRVWGLSSEKIAELTQAYRQAGTRGYWLKHIQQAKEGSDPTNMSPFWIAADYAMLGENDQAFAWLERAYEDRTFYMPWVAVECRLDGLHSDPRFAALLKKMGLKMPVWKK
jgi:serine/threonine protein kinase/Tfp pilus assembly protein PilF